MIQLKPYQQDCVAAIGSFIGCNLGNALPGRLLVLEAPTGAGKTVMLAALIDSALRDCAVLWVTPGKGDLEEQSYRALRSHLSSTSITVNRLSLEYLGAEAVAPPGSVLVLNWEEVTQTAESPELGERVWKNVLAKGKESAPGLFEHLRLTAENGTEVIVVVDESHYGKGNLTAIRRFLTAIESETALGYPPLRIEASATPLLSFDTVLLSQGRQSHVKVDLDDVIRDGMLAREIRVNAGLGVRLGEDTEVPEDTSERLVLAAAWNKTLDLRRQYREIGSPVTPLLVVQLPNNTATDDRANRKRDMIEAFFEERGINIENGRLMAWFSGEEKDEELASALADFDSPVEVLLFKQGISLGWDCPRAQVLLAFRDMAGDIFRIQTIGRILRTPERRHYNSPDHSDLDCAFVYSNIGLTTHLERDPGLSVNVELKRRFRCPALPASYVSRAGGYNDLSPRTARQYLAESQDAQQVLEALKTDERIDFIDVTEQIVSDQTVEVHEIMSGKVEDNEDTRVTLNTSDSDIETLFDQTMRELVSDWPSAARSVAAMRSVAYGWLGTIWAEADDETRVENVRRLLLNPELGASARAILRQASQAIRNMTMQSPPTIIQFSFTPQESLFHPDTSCMPAPQGLADKYLYEDPTGAAVITEKGLSEPEEAFISFIRSLGDNVIWWWKNGQGSTKFFSLAFTNSSGDTDTMYPDFIVQLSNGRILVIETKNRAATGTPEFSLDPDARNKANALTEWAGRQSNVVAGVGYRRGETWMIARTLDSADDIELRPLD